MSEKVYVRTCVFVDTSTSYKSKIRLPDIRLTLCNASSSFSPVGRRKGANVAETITISSLSSSSVAAAAAAVG